MNEKIREEIAFFRFSVIGSLISGELSHGELTKHIAQLSKRRYSIPYSHRTSIGQGTIEDWLYAYRYNGFEGLKPKMRSDQGTVRQIDQDTLKIIIDYRDQHPRMPLRLVLNTLRSENKIPAQQFPLSTVYRYLRRHAPKRKIRSEEHTSELQSRPHLVCRLLLEKKNEREHGELRERAAGEELEEAEHAAFFF